MILTTDGELANRLMHPSNVVVKRYHVTLKQKFPAARLGQLVRGQQVGGRPIAVEELSSGQAARTRDCQLLFVGRGSASALFSAARGAPVLTVGDRNNGARGGVVDFVLRDGRVRLAIDRRAADVQHLELSSKLLDVAVTVTR